MSHKNPLPQLVFAWVFASIFIAAEVLETVGGEIVVAGIRTGIAATVAREAFAYLVVYSITLVTPLLGLFALLFIISRKQKPLGTSGRFAEVNERMFYGDGDCDICGREDHPGIIVTATDDTYLFGWRLFRNDKTENRYCRACRADPLDAQLRVNNPLWTAEDDTRSDEERWAEHPLSRPSESPETSPNIQQDDIEGRRV